VRRRKFKGEYYGTVEVHGVPCKLYKVQSVTEHQWSITSSDSLRTLASSIARLADRYPDAGRFGRRVRRNAPSGPRLLLIVPQRPSASA
jgi:hypothetical protein